MEKGTDLAPSLTHVRLSGGLASDPRDSVVACYFPSEGGASIARHAKNANYNYVH